MDKHLHIVCFDVPWPADYGGVIDVLCRIKALYQQGIKIHLHCFTKNRKPQDELNRYCETVNYYRRKNMISSFSVKLPLMVNSRQSEELIANLEKDSYPILLEGIHCCFYLYKGGLANRKVAVRLHNVEFLYYRQLAKHESNFFKKLYFLYESRLLEKFEKAIANSAAFFAISRKDEAVYKNSFASQNTHFLPAFQPYNLPEAAEGKGCFCLYHGNLSINENEEAAAWLLGEVFSKIDLPLVIAGKNPSAKLQRMAHRSPHTCLVANPTEKEMQDMIAKAHIHVLPSFNNTGIKLKLLNAAFNGRHCLVNEAAVAGSGLETCCHIAEDAGSFAREIEKLYNIPFTEDCMTKRKQLLRQLYDDEKNALELINVLW